MAFLERRDPYTIRRNLPVIGRGVMRPDARHILGSLIETENKRHKAGGLYENVHAQLAEYKNNRGATPEQLEKVRRQMHRHIERDNGRVVKEALHEYQKLAPNTRRAGFLTDGVKKLFEVSFSTVSALSPFYEKKTFTSVPKGIRNGRMVYEPVADSQLAVKDVAWFLKVGSIAAISCLLMATSAPVLLAGGLAFGLSVLGANWASKTFEQKVENRQKEEPLSQLPRPANWGIRKSLPVSYPY
jgi:hypothetical protein